MKKNKNTKYRNERVVLLFPLTVTFCLACAACNIWLFVRSFNQALYKINEKPIATITFKYRTAQRKFLDRVVWDRLREHSPVYDGDTIRTAPLSEATVWFSDGNKMELYENTMAQVFLKADGLKADLASGGVTVDSAAASGGMTLSSGKVAVKVASGSAMSASSAPVTGTGGGISLQVIKGTAAVSGADNTQQTLDAGNAAVLSADGTTESVPSVIVTSPEPNAKLLYHTGTPLAVDFKWKTNNIPADTPVILEVSGSHDFSGPGQRITVTNLNEITVLLEPGTKYWRIIRDETGTTGTAVKTGGGVSAENTEPLSSGKLQILQSLPPACTAPATGY
ncbi:MAG: hypothetical protein M0P01_15300, partial [Treponema sp.]|nr:hypothetical protein [Treponema sp.]